MTTKQQANKEAGKFSETSAYFPILMYVLLSLCIRLVVLSPLMLLIVEPTGWSIQWLSILCPVVMAALVMPMRFSFAGAMMTAAQGNSFSLGQALRLTRYRKKLYAGLGHLLRLLCWSLPFVLVMGWVYYLIAFADAFLALRILSAMGAWGTGVLSFVAGLFGSATSLAGGFTEGLYLMAGIVALTLLLLVWGGWRCSVYRYLWAIRKQKGSRVRIAKQLHGYRRKQLMSGLFNFALWVPTLIFLFLIVMSIQSEFADLFTALMATKSMPPLVIPQGVWLLSAIGFLFHVTLLPIRRSVTAKFVRSISNAEKND